ncbi:rhodanese-like domain-containing protein [uncultured Desulfosarcina sp.]|uniref:rhodanese-like domain-containing protein n=1 Tax=uncultured Desulfosarcina sp. TaxID=218289 RepID=UPI0029C75A55|nr:rhodanese-like domain-containing protein [uncultured Desulfosarcina sp.]
MKRRPSIWIAALLVLLIGASACMASADKAAVQTLSPRQFKALLDRHHGDPDVVLLDVRTPKEFEDGHIQRALLLDYYSDDYVDRLKALDRNKTYLVYCRSGNRSGKSLVIFEKLGFRRVYNLDTGVIGWSGEKYPLVR